MLLGVPVRSRWRSSASRREANGRRDDVRACTSSAPGALSGLFGVAVQSVWETGLTTPANAVLAALAAAIVVHRSGPAAEAGA